MKKLAVVLSLLLTACEGETPTTPDINITNIISNTNTNTNGQGQVGPDGKPVGTLPSGVPTGVRVTQFSNPPGDRTITLGGTIQLTCTPRKADGTDYWAGIPDSGIKPPDYFRAVSGAGNIEVSQVWSNGYNLEVKGRVLGQTIFNCAVLGVEGSPAFVLNIVP